ncbi:S-layer homology domain-containing protein [Candidatus Gracilibacteria bacterium]|nr:S-layer homology domain-containing protein [Candidatus Gracilibacteria bacterium]
MPKTKKKTTSQKSLFWSWIASLSTKKPKKKLEKVASKRMIVARRPLTKRQVGKKSQRKIDITIVGLGIVLVVIFGFGNLQDFFKASILSVNQQNVVVREAKARLGIGYSLGSQGPNSYDCSGLTGTVMKAALGINLPRTSRDQYSVGREIAFAKLGIGDLVFFKTYGDNISHVGIITSISGSQVKMTHANSYTGKVEEEDIKNSTYWQKTYYGAREITEATKDLVAPTTPDPTYTPKPAIVESKDDEYNNYFPPSEPSDPRLKVGTATIERSTDNTKTITDTLISNSVTPSTTSTSTPTATVQPTTTVTAQPTTTVTAQPTTTVTTQPTTTVTTQPSVTPTASTTATQTATPIATATSSGTVASDFSDVPGNHQYASAIAKLSDMGVINGYSDGTFRPDAPVSRAELVKMVYKTLDEPTKDSLTSPFSDVASSHNLAPYILTAYNRGLVKGYSDRTFQPNRTVTRAEGSKIILKAFRKVPEAPKLKYIDINRSSDLTNYIGYLINHNLLQAADQLMRPDAPLTRGATAYILANLLAEDSN